MTRNVANVAYAHGMKSKTVFFSLSLFSPHTRKQQLTTFDRVHIWADRHGTDAKANCGRTKQHSTTFEQRSRWADAEIAARGSASPEPVGAALAGAPAAELARFVSDFRKYLSRLPFRISDQIGNLICTAAAEGQSTREVAV